MTKRILIGLMVLCMMVLAITASAATLSWTGPTTYTDGTAIPTTKTKTYTAKSSSAATGPWTSEGTTTSNNKTVSEPAAGAIKYYTVSVNVDGQDSVNATPVSKTAGFPTPSAPTGLQIN